MFVLVSNNFRKSFYIFSSIWLRMKIEFSGKSFTLIVKLRPLTQKMNAGSVLPSNHFRRHRRREREKERERERELDRAPPQTYCRVRATEIINAVVLDPKLIGAVVTDLVLVAHRRRHYRSRSHARNKAHRCRWSCRLNLVVVSLSLKVSITLSSSFSQFDQICMKFNELFWADFCFFKVYILKFL